MGSPTMPSSTDIRQRRRGPLTVTQQQLWVLDRCTSMPAALNLSYALAVDGPLDVTALAGAFRDLVRFHEPLRTTYPEYDGGPVAEVADEELALSALDLSPSQVPDANEAALLTRRDRARGFDLAHEAPIRASLLRMDEQRHVLLMTLHHIAADGWSLRSLSQQLSRGYADHLRGDPRPLTEHRVECIEFARRQRAWLRSPAADQEARWWVDRLRGATVRPPMLGKPRRDTGADLRRQVVEIPDGTSVQLQKLGRQASVSVFALLLTAFEALIQRWSGCVEPVIGTLAANRPTADSARLLGAHYNALLLNTDLSGDPSLAECLLRTAARAVRALDHQALPHAVLTETLERELGWEPGQAPSAMLLMDRYPLEALKLEGCRVTGQYLDDRAATRAIGGGRLMAPIPAATDADLTFFIREVEQRLTLSVLYPGAALDDGSVIGAISTYLELLSAMCDSPELPVSELTLSLPDPAAGAAPHDDGVSSPVLRDITLSAPVEVLSPVGRWTPGLSDNG